MPITNRSDFVDPQLLMEAVVGAFAGIRVLDGTNVAVVQDSMPLANVNGKPIKGGDTITIPYFNVLGQTLDIVSGEDDALTPNKLSQVSETAIAKHYGTAMEMTKWAELTANWSDPYGEFTRQFGEMTKNRIEDELIVVAGASLDAAFTSSLFSSSAPHTLTLDDIIAAKMLWGDEQTNVPIKLLTVHSKVYQDLLQLKDGLGRPLITTPDIGKIPQVLGVPVVVSDRNTVTTVSGKKQYQSLLLKQSALAFWYQSQPIVLQAPDPLAGSILTGVHVYGAPYRYKRAMGGSKVGVVAILSN